MTYGHHTFWYFTTTQCPVWLHSTFPSYLGLEIITSTAGQQVYSHRQFSAEDRAQPCCVHSLYPKFTCPDSFPAKNPQGLPGPAIPSLNPSIHARFSAYWLQCHSTIQSFPKRMRHWKSHLLQMTSLLWHAEQTGSWGAKGKVFMEDLLWMIKNPKQPWWKPHSEFCARYVGIVST